MDSNNSINSNNWSENQMDLSKNNLSTADVKGKENELFDGLPIDEVYKIAIKYYKEKERAGELPLEYPLRLQFLAHSKQAKYGSFVDDVADYGWFDLVGNDVRKEWKKLSETNPGKEQSMLEFIRLLDAICPTFRTHVQEQTGTDKNASKKEHNNQKSSEAINRLQNLGSEVVSKETLQKFEQQKQLIQEALNKQTYHQFLSYAQQTHPGNPEKQEELIKQLQHQHFEQYMAQVYARQAHAQVVSIEAASSKALPDAESTSDSEAGLKSSYAQQHSANARSKIRNVDENLTNGDDDESDVSDEAANDTANPKISPASMWSVKEIREFKASIQKESPDGVLKIGHGELITVRVPTIPDGNTVVWEFATDHYDIGFGVYFEWTKNVENQTITVHVDESEDEGDEEITTPDSNESGDVESRIDIKKNPNKPHIDEIIPVFRRDSHQEVIVGSHAYPGTGVYLLKFDNSYSLWRSKTIYFRIYFSK